VEPRGKGAKAKRNTDRHVQFSADVHDLRAALKNIDNIVLKQLLRVEK